MRGVRWLLALGFLSGVCGCGHSIAAPERDVGPPEVSLVQPIRQTIRYTVEQPGRIEPFEQTPLHARIAGYVRAVRVEIGTRVKRGAVLAELSVPELVEEHARKKALVVQARLGINQARHAERVARASLVSAKATIEVAQAARGKAVAAAQRWKTEFERMEKLVRQNVVDRQSRDETRRQLQSAEAARTESEAQIRATQATLAEVSARLDKTGADLAAAENQLVVAEADERQTQAMLAYTRIVAPYDGVISDRRVHTGHLLQAAAGGSTGHPLFTIVRTDKVRVFVEVPETDAIQVRDGTPGRIRVQALNDREFVGKVTGTSWSLDPSQRTLRTEIDFPNAGGVLRPGMYVHAFIDVERPSAWVIPASSVLVRDGMSFAYRIREGKTHRLPLRLGLRAGKVVEVRKVQVAGPSQGAPRWTDPTGEEKVVETRPGELIDNQAVQVIAPERRAGR